MRWSIVLALAGCWRSTPATAPPVEQPIAHRAPADAYVDEEELPAAVDWPAPIDAAPPPLPDPQRDCPSGRGMIARVIGLSVTGSGTDIIAGAGSQRGVAADWSVSLGGTPCRMISVDTRVTRAACVMTPDMVKVASVALLCAP